MNKVIMRLTIIILAALFTSGASVLAQTKILIYQAYSQQGSLNPNLVVAQRYSGNCWTKSLSDAGRTDTWRCQANNLIMDPCFQDGNNLACIVSPWAHKATIIELNSPLYKNPDKTVKTASAFPWALELENGQRCIILTGATNMINNSRVNYGCTDTQYGILGDINKSSPTWKANLYNFLNKTSNEIPINIAWF